MHLLEHEVDVSLLENEVENESFVLLAFGLVGADLDLS